MVNMATNPTPINSAYLDEADGHKVFFTEYGNPTGPAIVVLHGGPGSQSKPKQVKGYDLTAYHVITFDQRGCGKSEPAGKTENNTLYHLLSDMERLREKLHLSTWFVAGGSWGSTLALAYAERHPNRVSGLLLSSIFLATPEDENWSFSAAGGVERLFPDVWAQRLAFLESFQVSPAQAPSMLLSKLETGTQEEKKAIAAGVMNWEGNLMNAQADISYLEPDEMDDSDVASTRIFLHFEAHQFFLEPDQLLKNTAAITQVPTIIVHGRYDALCPVDSAWKLHQLLPHSQLLVLPSSNHRLTAEGEIARKLAFRQFLFEHVQ